MNITSRLMGGLAVIALLLIVAYAAAAYANHSWGAYHWARSANPLTLQMGDNVTSVWDMYLASAIADWNVSEVLDTGIVTGMSNPKNCKPVAGRVEVCNNRYGRNGWLGVASVWINGDHITQATVKLNDTYFLTSKYNTTAWRNLVMCQEVGHVFGLDHQDEDFGNTPMGTCMDYSNDPVPNQHPNQHDYDQLAAIYAHLDSVATTTVTTNNNGYGNGNGLEASEWGKAIRTSVDGRHIVFERNLGKGQKVFTFVVWADKDAE